MSVKVASLIAEIGADTTGFTKGAGGVKKGLADMAKQYLSTAAVITAFGTAVSYSIESASQAQRVDAQLGAVLESTGHAAGMARSELEDLATSLSRVSTYDDEAIKSSEALLLTFTQIGSDVFPTATQAILDMSTAIGTDLQSATIQVGKALNDPINGITALSRVGVSFTEQQKDQIKALVATGNSMDAQKIILAELSKEFGGSALAASKTYEGQLKILKNEFGNVAEEIGVQLIPKLTELSHAMVENMDTFREDRKEMNDFTEFLNYPISTIIKWTVGIDENAESAKDAEQATKDFGDAAELAAEQQKADAEAVKELQKANESLIDGAIDITERNKDFAQSQQDILDNIKDTRAEGENLYPWEAEKIAENQAKLDELGQAYFDNLEDFKAAMQEKFTLYAVEQIAMSDGVAGFSEAEYEKARIILETTDVATAAAFEEQQAMANLAQAVSDGTIPVEDWGAILEEVMADGVVSIDEVAARIEAVPKENAITFTITTIGAPPNLDISAEAADAPKGTHRKSNALGGSFVIPSSYGNEGFMLGGGDTASGGERLTINPAGKSGNEDIIAALERNRLDENKIVRLMEGVLQRNSR